MGSVFSDVITSMLLTYKIVRCWGLDGFAEYSYNMCNLGKGLKSENGCVCK